MITAVSKVSSKRLFIANIPESVESTNYLCCTKRELSFFIPFRLGTISQQWKVNTTLENIGSQHSWVPESLKSVYSRMFNAKTQTRAGHNSVVTTAKAGRSIKRGFDSQKGQERSSTAKPPLNSTVPGTFPWDKAAGA
jgi:hypothetical protein